MRKINEIFYSLQGEGFHTGTPARIRPLLRLQPEMWLLRHPPRGGRDDDGRGDRGEGIGLSRTDGDPEGRRT